MPYDIPISNAVLYNDLNFKVNELAKYHYN